MSKMCRSVSVGWVYVSTGILCFHDDVCECMWCRTHIYVCLFIQHGSRKRKTNRTLEISRLSSPYANRMHASGVPCLCVCTLVFPCLHAISQSSVLLCHVWKSMEQRFVVMRRPLPDTQIGAHMRNTKTHTRHQTFMRHTVGVAWLRLVTLSLNGSVDMKQLWCIREKMPQLACAKYSIHKQGGLKTGGLNGRDWLNENEARGREGNLLPLLCVTPEW